MGFLQKWGLYPADPHKGVVSLCLILYTLDPSEHALDTPP
jgi:hypothetical protein